MDEKINQWLQTYAPINEIAEIDVSAFDNALVEHDDDIEVSKFINRSGSEIKEKIHNERLTENARNLALQRTGFDELPLKYVTDKGWYRQYQYMLLLKSESEIDEQRLTNLDWLDDLSDWLAEQNRLKNFPILEDGKKVLQVSCANALTYQESEDGALSIYSLQLYFNVRKEQ